MRLLFLSSWDLLLPTFLAACHPVDDVKLYSGLDRTNITLPFINRNASSLSQGTYRLGDWEHFTYPIPDTRRVLKGRILTYLPIRETDLHYMIDGGLALTMSQISRLGSSNVRLADRDNPYVYRVPHCHFKMSSKIMNGKAIVTYGMMKKVFQALEQLLEAKQKSFAISFVLTDASGQTLGHGDVFERSQSPSVLGS